MRRENQKGELQVNDYLGLPLHAQGKRRDKMGNYAYPRITPACAGKTQRIQRIASLFRDYPCMRRENVSINEVSNVAAGLPLHAQGKLSARELHERLNRITPACAGKTNSKRFQLLTE